MNFTFIDLPNDTKVRWTKELQRRGFKYVGVDYFFGQSQSEKQSISDNREVLSEYNLYENLIVDVPSNIVFHNPDLRFKLKQVTRIVYFFSPGANGNGHKVPRKGVKNGRMHLNGFVDVRLDVELLSKSRYTFDDLLRLVLRE